MQAGECTGRAGITPCGWRPPAGGARWWGAAGRPIRTLGRGIMGDRGGGAVTGKQRIAAVVALLSGAATLVLAVTVAIIRFPNGLGVLACVVVAVVASWFGVVRRGTRRVVGIAVAVLALLGAVALLFRNGGWPYLICLVIGVAIWHTSSTTSPSRSCTAPSSTSPITARVTPHTDTTPRLGGADRAAGRAELGPALKAARA